jgi:7-cyano-7-deazaguanine synthase
MVEHVDVQVKNTDAAPLAVVLLSGGLDSMVCAGLALEQGFRVLALTIDYNQRHRIELDAARKIAARLRVHRHVVLPLDLRQFGGSALTDAIDVPKDGVGPDIPVTYVPARNLVFLLALAWAEAAGSKDLFIGVNALDYSGYPDCRPEFVAGFEGLARIATKFGSEGGTVRVHAPLQYLTKAGIARSRAARAGYGESWSCYDPCPMEPPAACATAVACGRLDLPKRDWRTARGMEDPETPAERRKSPRIEPYSWYALGVLVIVYILNFIDRQLLTILAVDLSAISGFPTANSASSMAPRSACSMRCSAFRWASWRTAGRARGCWRSASPYGRR